MLIFWFFLSVLVVVVVVVEFNIVLNILFFLQFSDRQNDTADEENHHQPTAQ